MSIRAADCIFCGIAAGEAKSARVYEDDSVQAFLNIAPATEGHTLVIPKRHARNIFDITPAALEAVAVVAKRVAEWQRDRLACDGVTLFQSNEEAGWQSVFHYHVHVVPRYRDDRLVPPWRPTTAEPATLERIARRLRGD